MREIRMMLVMMLVGLFALASCNQENVAPEVSVSGDLNAQNVVQGDSTNSGYDEDDDEDENEDESEESGEEEGEEIDPASLPQVILDYIAEHYPGVEILEAELYPNGEYEVELDNDVELLFDAAGNFLGEGD